MRTTLPGLVLALAGLLAPLTGCIEIQVGLPSSMQCVERAEDASPRLLAVVAHPDDESTFAATLYAASRGLGGICDVVVITNGEGGFKYSTLAQDIYGAQLVQEDVGREQLPDIRRWEMFQACSWLGVRDLRFLDQRDHRYTTDEGEVLAEGADVWDLSEVRSELRSALEQGRYEAVLCLLPTAGTHAHHKAATILALEAVAALPAEQRPVVLGATVEDDEERIEPDLGGLPGWPVTRLDETAGRFVFDRRRRFGFRDALDWRIVVDWDIAAHKSQGTLQMMAGQGAREVFFLFAGGPPDGSERAAELFERLAGVTFAVPEYGSSAGTNAQPVAR